MRQSATRKRRTRRPHSAPSRAPSNCFPSSVPVFAWWGAFAPREPSKNLCPPSIWNWTFSTGNWAGPSRPLKCAAFWKASGSRCGIQDLAPSPSGSLHGAPPKMFPWPTTWWRKSVAWLATTPSHPRHRWCPVRPCPIRHSGSSSAGFAAPSLPRATPKSPTIPLSAKPKRRVSVSGRKSNCAF